MTLKLVSGDKVPEGADVVGNIGITQELIQSAIKSLEYYLFRGTTHMCCCVTMTNGFTVLGESACCDHSKFSPSLGEKYAREDAERKIGELLAYGQVEKLMFGGKYEH